MDKYVPEPKNRRQKPRLSKLSQNFVTHITAVGFSLVKPVLEEALHLLDLLQLLQLQLVQLLVPLLQTLQQFFALPQLLNPFQPEIDM